MKLYVGNLPYAVDDAGLLELFSHYGAVESARIARDPESGRPKGYGFVEMSHGDALKAMGALNRSQLGGRTIHVHEAKGKGSPGPPSSGPSTDVPFGG